MCLLPGGIPAVQLACRAMRVQSPQGAEGIAGTQMQSCCARDSRSPFAQTFLGPGSAAM